MNMSEQSSMNEQLPKPRSLSESEKNTIRSRLHAGDLDVHILANEFGCSWSQIAGFKALLKMTTMGKQRRTGNELFHNDGVTLSASLLEFWQWVDSDLVSNTIRGRLAEYLVARDLGIANGIRSEWIAYDLTSRKGTKVEVKSAAYVQTWAQRRPSPISFDIRPTLGWDPDTAKFGDDRKRQAEVYVFVLLCEQDESKLDSMNVSHWRFFVLPTRVLDSACPKQKNIGLKKLLTLKPEEVSFGAIAAAVERALKTGANTL